MTLYRKLANRRRTTWQRQQNGWRKKLPPKSVHDSLDALQRLMRSLVLLLIVSGVMLLSACSTSPSLPPTVQRNPPEACLTACPALPPLADGSDLSVRLWELEAIDLYGQCRRDKAVCAEFFKEK